MKSFAHTSLPIINAHRGAIYDAVENSLDAFTLGIEQGAKSLELDVVRLASSELVVFHGGGNHENPGEVSHLFSKIEDDLDDDASSSYDPSSPSSYSSTAANEVESRSLIRNCETAEIPLLSEVLDLCKERGVHIALEMKGQGVEHDCLRMVEQAGMLPLVTFSSFHNEKTALIRNMRRNMESVKTAKIFDTPLTRDWIEQTKSQHCNEAHICFIDCTPRNISLAHSHGIIVMGWFPHPVNESIWCKYTEDSALYEFVARSGVDIMCVNKPGLLKRVLDDMASLAKSV